tara:strand:+ start:1890 stop:5324 length:3435 start_codon:yes stop_codon:yes gene_type:complete
MADSVQKRIQDLEISIKEFQLGVKDIVENGEKAKKTYGELLSEFKRLTTTAENLAKASKNSFAQPTTTSKQYLSFLTKINTGLQNISSSNKQLEKTERKTLSTRQEIQKKWDDRKFKRTLARLKKEQNDRIAAEIKVQKRRESIQEKWNNRKRRRDNAASKRRGKERLAEERKVQKQLENTAKKRDFKGGFASQLSPRAIGGAIGSLTKYLGIYRLLNGAISLFNELTIGSARQAIEFQKQLAELGAVAGVSTNEIKVLGDNALDVAGKTKFTASQVVSLQRELSKLGFTAREVAAATEGIAFAAQALGSPLDATAETIGKVINQFGLLKTDTAFVGDVLVTSINNSALSFDSFGTAIQYVGPIARNLGLTFQQTAGAMAVLADNGFTASRIGTGLRGILTELAKTSVDAEAELKSLAEQNLSLSEAVDLVGKRNAAQLITLLDNIEAIDKSTNSYYEQGRALTAASKQASSFSGQLQLMNSAFRQFQITTAAWVAESDVLINVLTQFGGVFFDAASSIRGFKIIEGLDFKKFTSSAKKAANGANSYAEAIKLLAETDEDVAKNQEYLLGQVERSGIVFPNAGNVTNELAQKVRGLGGIIETAAAQMESTAASTEGTTRAQQGYGKAIDRFKSQAKRGEVSLDALNDSHENLSDSISGLTSTQKSLNEELDSGVGLTKEQERELKNKITTVSAEIKQLKEYEDILINIIGLEKQRYNNEIKEAQAKTKSDLKEIVDLIKEQAKYIGDINIEDVGLVYDTELDILNELFGSADDIISMAKERFGPEFAAELSKIFEDTAGNVQTFLGREPEELISLPSKDATAKFFETTANSYAGAANEGLRKGAEEFDNTTFWEATVAGFKDLKAEEIIGPALDTVGEILSDFNDVALENAKAQADAELEIIENRYKTEEEILKSQLNNQLITESQFRTKQKELQRAQASEENAIEKNVFDAEKKRDRQNATTDYLQSLASIIPNLIVYDKEGNPVKLAAKAAISAALTTAAYGAELAAIGQRKFIPKKFEDGGLVYGASHADGGIPFSVRGNRGYEMEGGEFIVNKDATSKNLDLLKKINSSTKRPTIGRTKFADGGLVSSPLNESVDYLKAIAEATTSTAIQTSKPVRAYVSSSDLRINETERRLRDRNDRI